MANNLTVEAPDFDYIYRETGVATRDAVQTLWLVANDEAATRRSAVREAIERQCPKEIILSPAGNQNDLDTQFATVIRFDGSTNFDLTGLQARTEPTILYLHVLGSGTVTLRHQNAGSLARNRIITYSGASLAVTTGLTVMLMYLNSRWREVKWA